VDGSTRCVVGAAEPPRLSTFRMGNGDAHAGRPSVRAILIATWHDDADGRRSSRRPIRAATTEGLAPRGALPPRRRGKSGAATPLAWGRAPTLRRRRRRQRQGAFVGAALVRGGAAARFSDFCGGAAGPKAAQSVAVFFWRRRADPLSSCGAGGQFSPMFPGVFPSSVSDAVGLDVWYTAWPFLLGTGVLGGRTVCGGFPGLLFFASMRYGKTPSCGADAAATDGGDVVLCQRRCTGGCALRCAEAGWSVVCSVCGVPLGLVSAFGARARVSSSSIHVLTAGRVNPDWGVSCLGGKNLHRKYLAARYRAN